MNTQALRTPAEWQPPAAPLEELPVGLIADEI